MDHLEDNIRQLVREALQDLKQNVDTSNPSDRMGVFATMDEAVNAAEKAFHDLADLTLEVRKDIIASIRKVSTDNIVLLSKMASDETGMGRWEDKVIKNELAIKKTPGVEDIIPETFSDDHGLALVEHAPYGVLGSISPSTNPTASIISNCIGMIAAGNSVVFNVHPAAKKVSNLLVELLNKGIVKAGGPKNLITTVEIPTLKSANTMMSHPKVAMLVVTGGPGVVKAAMKMEKKTIAAGPGNPPCVVDETADLIKAGKDIVNGASFDNNLICICEKETIVVESVADRLKVEMEKNGAYILSPDQIKKVTALVIADAGRPGHEGGANKDYVGKNASVIAKAIGLTVPDSTRLLLCEVDENHPLVWTEQLMPVMPLVRVANVDYAIDLAQRCEHGFRHTAIMHSHNIAALSKMARVMNCSIFIKNGPSYAGLGNGGAGFASFTIASPTGEGVTRARTFTRERRCTMVDFFRII